jgi:hypothetical protein
MWDAWEQRRGAWLGIGLVLGICIGAMLPHTPSYAVATDRHETFAICTGSVDDDLEAIYFLDFLTGDLRALTISLRTSEFVGYYEYNVTQDLATDAGKTPRYGMITGYARLRQNTGQLRPSHALLYVTEGTSGMVAAYALPWNGNLAQAVKPYNQSLVKLDAKPMRNVVIREE